MSVCAQVSKFDSLVSCKQSKFQQKIRYKWKMWMIEHKVSTDAEDLNRCRRFWCMSMILYYLQLTGILPVLKL